MAKRFLIDLTDPRFSIAANDDVLAFVRRANPFAHTDGGGLLFELGRDQAVFAFGSHHQWCS